MPGELNGYDRVTRYKDSNDEVFRAFVGDDMNGLIQSISALTNKLDKYSTRMLGMQISLIMLLLGVVADIVIRK